MAQKVVALGTEMFEPSVTIEGQELSFAEAMTLRVAVSSFLSNLAEHGLGDDEHGRTMTENYLKNGRRIEALMVNACNAAAKR